MPKTWIAAAFQLDAPQAVLAKARSRDDVHKIVADQCAVIDRRIDQLETKPDLVLTPEYFLSGGKGPNNIGVIPFQSPEIEMVQKLAVKKRTFIASNIYATDPRFPDRFMNTSFVIDRTGNIVLKSFRLHTNHSVSPHDFWDEFLQKAGLDGVFPVTDTELGKLAIFPSMELVYPEVTRALVLRGAEVILHTTYGSIMDRDVARARAIENEAYVITCNAARLKGIHPSMDVGSYIIDWRGEYKGQILQGIEGVAVGAVDIDEMRAKRGDMDMEYKNRGPNYLARMRVEMFRDIYGKTSLFPPNTYRRGKPFPVAGDFFVNNDMSPQANQFAISKANMKKRGII